MYNFTDCHAFLIENNFIPLSNGDMEHWYLIFLSMKPSRFYRRNCASISLLHATKRYGLEKQPVSKDLNSSIPEYLNGSLLYRITKIKKLF